MHESVSGMYRLGLVDETTMRKFDARCIVVVKPKKSGGRSAQKKAKKTRVSP